jgi:hypothetical protein
VIIPQPFNYRAFAQPFKTPVKVMADVTKRLVKTFADLTQVKIFEIEQFQSVTLDDVQIFEGALQVIEVKFPSDFPLHIRVSNQSSFKVIRRNPRAQVEPGSQQMRLSITGPAVRNLDNPDFCASPGGFEGAGFSKHIQKTLLNDLLRLARIAEDTESDAVDHSGVAAEKFLHRVWIFVPQALNELFIAQGETLDSFRDGSQGAMQCALQCTLFRPSHRE